MNKLEIHNITALHFNDVIRLSNQQFGSDYISDDKLKLYVTDKNKKGFVILNNQQFIGYVLFSICSDFSDIAPLILKDKKELELLFNNKYPLGIIETIVVDKNIINKGVGSQLVSKVMNELKDVVLSVVSFLWEHPNGTPLATLLNKYHFSHQKTIQNYWFEDSKIKKYKCKYCGTPCKCNCLVYSKVFI